MIMKSRFWAIATYYILTLLTHSSLGCADDEYECLDGSGCVPNKWFCDGYANCRDRSDESYNLIYHGAIKCRRGRLICTLPHGQAHKKSKLCLLGSKCANDESLCYRGVFMNTCVPRNYCNNADSCYVTYNIREKEEGEIMCHGLSKVFANQKCPAPELHLCNGSPLCSDELDECFCEGFNKMSSEGYVDRKCFRCLSDKDMIAFGKVCDGKIDCEDLSDECFCSNREVIDICKNVIRDDETMTLYILCDITTLNRTVSQHHLCDGNYHCDDMADEQYCPNHQCPSFMTRLCCTPVASKYKLDFLPRAVSKYNFYGLE